MEQVGTEFEHLQDELKKLEVEHEYAQTKWKPRKSLLIALQIMAVIGGYQPNTQY